MNRKFLCIIILAAFFSASCTSFLDKTPQGILTDEEINSPEYVDNLVTSAYAIWVSGDDINSSFSLWNYDVRSDDCYKGGSGAADGDVFHFLEIANGTNTTDWNISDIWSRLYKCVTRANTALKSLDGLSEVAYPLKNTRMAEMKFLRGHALFLLKELFNRIVIADESVDTEAYTSLSNVTYTSDEQWGKIADDFKYAYDNLPVQQKEIGRPTKAAAAAYLAKTMLYKAYRQDEAHNVTEINTDDLNAVLTYTDDAIFAAGGFGLESDYAMNFLPEDENGKESIWAIQYSINDGTFYGNLNFGMMLTVPQFFGCCDFHKPSQNLVNSFKTINGLPEFDNYNFVNYNSANDDSDPRLFHTVAMPGFPYKYNSSYIFEESWSRNPTFYGVYSSLKENVDPGCSCQKKVSGTFWANSMNHIVIRYADVLLIRAEALIELNRSAEALPLINKVRSRAAASTNYIKSYAPNLKISTYIDGKNCVWSQNYARQALRWERRLEFGMESSRFFDLVRWGVAADVINTYYRSEESRRSYYSTANFTKGKNEYLPIPYSQITASGNLCKQNNGW